MRYCLVMVLLLAGGMVRADDGGGGMAGEGGRMRLLDGEHASVGMVRERVRIDLYSGYYEVQARFIFHNDGPAVTVTMAFPEGGSGDGEGAENYRTYRERSGFRHFSSTVDGKPVRVKRTVKVVEDSRYSALWVKKVSFARGQTREVGVRYRAEPGFAGSIDTYSRRLFGYNFTGGNWKGKQQRGELTVISHIPGVLMLDVSVPDAKRLVRRQAQRNCVTFVWKDWQAEGDFGAEYTTTVTGGLNLAPLPNLKRSRENEPATWIHDPLLVPHDYTLVNPGMPKTVDSLPALRRRGGDYYVNARALAGYLSALAGQAGRERQVALSWDEPTATAILQAGRTTFRFRPNRREMHVNGRAVPLSTAPFISISEQNAAGSLYVPLPSVLHALNGTMTVDAKQRTVTLTVPAFWTK